MGKGTPGFSRCWFCQQLSATTPPGQRWGWGTRQQGVLARLGEASVSEPTGQWGARHCPALLCPPLLSYPGCLSTLSPGLQCPSLTIKAELGSPQCCLRLTPVGTLLGAFGR